MEKIYRMSYDTNTDRLFPQIKQIIKEQTNDIESAQYELDGLNRGVKRFGHPRKNNVEPYIIARESALYEQERVQEYVKKSTDELNNFKYYVYIHFKYISE